MSDLSCNLPFLGFWLLLTLTVNFLRFPKTTVVDWWDFEWILGSPGFPFLRSHQLFLWWLWFTQIFTYSKIYKKKLNKTWKCVKNFGQIFLLVGSCPFQGPTLNFELWVKWLGVLQSWIWYPQCSPSVCFTVMSSAFSLVDRTFLTAFFTSHYFLHYKLRNFKAKSLSLVRSPLII